MQKLWTMQIEMKHSLSDSILGIVSQIVFYEME